MENLNIQMDANAKWWWEKLSHAKSTYAKDYPRGRMEYFPTKKLATFNRTIFDLHTQYQYSKCYWE